MTISGSLLFGHLKSKVFAMRSASLQELDKNGSRMAVTNSRNVAKFYRHLKQDCIIPYNSMEVNWHHLENLMK